MLDRAVTELVWILGKTLGVKITVGKMIISFIEGGCYGLASSLAGPTRTSCGLVGPADGHVGDSVNVDNVRDNEVLSE